LKKKIKIESLTSTQQQRKMLNEHSVAANSITLLFSSVALWPTEPSPHTTFVVRWNKDKETSKADTSCLFLIQTLKPRALLRQRNRQKPGVY